MSVNFFSKLPRTAPTRQDCSTTVVVKRVEVQVTVVPSAPSPASSSAACRPSRCTDSFESAPTRPQGEWDKKFAATAEACLGQLAEGLSELEEGLCALDASLTAETALPADEALPFEETLTAEQALPSDEVLPFEEALTAEEALPLDEALPFEDTHEAERPSSRAVMQTTDTNCGAAAVATVASAKKKVPVEASDAEVVDELTSRFNGNDGTTPEELSRMLASKGLEVEASTAQFDERVVNDALKKGEKVVALVDSNRIASTTGAKDPGAAHWVVVDGLDEQGRYDVKDPGTGSSYSVGREDLQHAVADGWGMHKGGGLVVTKDAQPGKSEDQLAQENAQKSQALGSSPGIGSRAKGTFGRESA
jgi:predicted double-glycine peptidase